MGKETAGPLGEMETNFATVQKQLSDAKGLVYALQTHLA